MPVATNNQHCGAGTQTAALTAGGNTGATGYLNTSLEYNGSSWSSGGNLITARKSAGGFGTQTAGVITGGTSDSSSAAGNLTSTEEYNGTAFSAGGSLLTARQALATAGSASAGLVAAGGGGGVTTEEYINLGAGTYDQLFTGHGDL